jgi:hypothetical protein
MVYYNIARLKYLAQFFRFGTWPNAGVSVRSSDKHFWLPIELLFPDFEDDFIYTKDVEMQRCDSKPRSTFTIRTFSSTMLYYNIARLKYLAQFFRFGTWPNAGVSVRSSDKHFWLPIELYFQDFEYDFIYTKDKGRRNAKM